MLISAKKAIAYLNKEHPHTGGELPNKFVYCAGGSKGYFTEDLDRHAGVMAIKQAQESERQEAKAAKEAKAEEKQTNSKTTK